MFPTGSLVRVLSGSWEGALGLVKWTDPGGVRLRLGNGVVVTEPELELEAVEYMPGTGCPATFTEELNPDARHARPPWAAEGKGLRPRDPVDDTGVT
jgi:hypothetical protein